MDPDIKTKMLTACQDGNIAIIENMFINGTEITQDALEEASSYGKLELVQFLIEKCGLKARANSRQALKNATNNGHAHVFTYLQKKVFEEVNKLM